MRIPAAAKTEGDGKIQKSGNNWLTGVTYQKLGTQWRVLGLLSGSNHHQLIPQTQWYKEEDPQNTVTKHSTKRYLAKQCSKVKRRKRRNSGVTHSNQKLKILFKIVSTEKKLPFKIDLKLRILVSFGGKMLL